MGNICRSPTAEGVAARMLAERGLTGRVELDSAGTHDYHVGSPPDRRSQEAAAERGVDLSGLRAREVTPSDLDCFDLILAMDGANLARLQAMQARHGGEARVGRLLEFAAGGEVPDPYFGGDDGFQRVLDAIEAGCRGLVDAIERGDI